MTNALTLWRAIAEEAECVVQRGTKYLMLTEEMCVRLGTALEDMSDKQEAAQPISDAMMDLVDRLGSEAKNVDPRAWDHMLVYVPKAETKSPDGISYEHLFELANMCGLIGAYSVKEVNDKVVGYARVVLNDSAVQEAFVRANRRALVTSPDKDLK
ncbi:MULTISPECIES: hypothetical protein [unclassified Caballeronia]|uniref:hypothetical protein n=1 Tax=unclassified Caballeronia TaxID=2646786 RepID=UPI00285D05B0|nr:MULTISPECIES: hypothetical protein [unclassified Caballeronia]MDR5776239.1 hypothetical protein [Caballeronia sp. LZ002]MDR5801158.1 hypothetical protein [Caballeronia sp. LZ001]MDR5851679.1 hypothetical protein [Caballeronia sp. LZ003]